MRSKKIILWMLVPFLWVSMLYSQDLVELAKKEKARRAKIEAKKTVVVTNSDLKRVKTGSVVQAKAVRPPAAPATSASPAGAPAETAENIDQAEGPPEVSLEEKWRRADTNVRHLDMSLTRLGQQYYNARTSEEKERIQKQIDQTERELASARKETEKLRTALDKEQKK
jgi:hypothetical protein